MVIDDEGIGATVFAVVTLCLSHQSLPRLCHGNPYHGGGSGSRSPQQVVFESSVEAESEFPGRGDKLQIERAFEPRFHPLS